MNSSTYRSIDISINDRFGRLTVVERLPELKNERITWTCVCSCGGWCEVAGSNLVPPSGAKGTESCGCAPRGLEKGQKRGNSVPKSVYRAWNYIKQRCLNINSPSWAKSNAAICQDWVESPLGLFAEVGDRPTKHHVMSLINPNGDYEPGNVAWMTVAQRRNRQTADPDVPRAGVKIQTRPDQWLWRGKWRNK